MRPFYNLINVARCNIPQFPALNYIRDCNITTDYQVITQRIIPLLTNHDIITRRCQK